MDDEQVVLPGFRFYPTDEELVSFYLRRKIENKPISIEVIKTMDIYKYDPWDLPKNGSVADKEWYFFCKRGRKYRNSVRPNRVAASGFWKATGIDKPIYSNQGQGHGCIGLKKSLVYHRGSAGKGTKTGWMMHEFRLPADHKNSTHLDVKAADEAVEVWTLCRIFRRNMSQGRSAPDWREMPAKCKPTNSRPKPEEYSEDYISFGALEALENEKKLVVGQNMGERDQLQVVSEQESCSSTVLSHESRELLVHGNWDEIVSAMDYPFDPYHF